MKQFFVTLAGVFVGLMLFLVAVPVVLVMIALANAKPSEPVMPSAVVLELDLRLPMTDQQPRDFVSRLNGAQSTVGVVQALMAAEKDDRVKGLYIRAAESGLDPATAEEVRTAINEFREAGKFVITHSQGITSPLAYMAISSSDEIWMQASSDLAATGMSMETPFFRGLLDKFEIQPELMAFYEYKNAADPLLHKDYTPAHKEAATALLTSLYDTSADLAAVGRDLQPAELKNRLQKGPLSAMDAQAAGLVDEIGYDQQAEDAALARAGDQAELMDIAAYPHAKKMFAGRGPSIAIVGGEGLIITGSPEAVPGLPRDPEMLGDEVADAIRAATDNKDVKAIVFRVNSRGGSPVASDQIWAAVKDAQKAGKPVVVSMGPYAASGGYYVATGADAIVANASTITGSIGVVGGKVAISKALANYGINMSTITVGDDFASMDTSQPFTASQRQKMHRLLERVYNDFTAKVADGRKLPPSQVEDIAKGRVYSGAQARELGLVDSIGGLRTAINTARRLAELPADEPVRLKRFPAERSPFEEIQNLLQSNISAQMKLAAFAGLLDSPHVKALQAQAQTQGKATVTAPITEIQ